MKNNKYCFSTGEVQVITFENFIKRILVFKANSDPVSYNTMIKMWDGDGYAFGEEQAETTSDYVQVAAPLIGGDRTSALSVSLQYQSLFQEVYYYDLINMVEDALVQDACAYGSADFLIKVDKRRWLVANPEDFEIREKNGKYAIACKVKARTIIYQVQKKSLSEYKAECARQRNQVIAALNR